MQTDGQQHKFSESVNVQVMKKQKSLHNNQSLFDKPETTIK